VFSSKIFIEQINFYLVHLKIASIELSDHEDTVEFISIPLNFDFFAAVQLSLFISLEVIFSIVFVTCNLFYASYS